MQNLTWIHWSCEPESGVSHVPICICTLQIGQHTESGNVAGTDEMALTDGFVLVPVVGPVEALALVVPASSGWSLAAGCRPIEHTATKSAPIVRQKVTEHDSTKRLVKFLWLPFFAGDSSEQPLCSVQVFS